MTSGLDRVKAGTRIALGTLKNVLDAPVLVLLYHRVTSLARDPQRLAVRPENFRRQLQWLKKEYPVLRFDESWRAARRPAVVLSFDDGYADNAREALPVAEEMEVPVTFFVSTGTLGSRREFWWDELERCLEAAPPGARSFALRPAGAPEEVFPAATQAERAALYRALHPRLKLMTLEARDQTLAALRAWAGTGETGRESHRPLAIDELRTLASSPWTAIGAHSVNHAPLARLSPQAQRDEIETSRRQLQGWTGRPVELFSYPFGGPADYDRHSVALCRAAGFRKAAANVPGNWHRWHSEFEIPRRLVRDWDVAEFASRIRLMFRQ
jgi:peptidoglycan/xylan/chitin deacetylase (PgdA/CDA1 family)